MAVTRKPADEVERQVRATQQPLQTEGRLSAAKLPAASRCSSGRGRPEAVPQVAGIRRLEGVTHPIGGRRPSELHSACPQSNRLTTPLALPGS